MTKYQTIRTAQYMIFYYYSKSNGFEDMAKTFLDELPSDFLEDEEAYNREVSAWLMAELKKERKRRDDIATAETKKVHR